MSEALSSFVGRAMVLLGQGTFGRGTITRMPQGLVEARAGSTVRLSGRNIFIDGGIVEGNNNNVVGNNNVVRGCHNTVSGTGNVVEDPSHTTVERVTRLGGLSGSMRFPHRATAGFDRAVPGVTGGTLRFHRSEKKTKKEKGERATKQKKRTGKSRRP